MGGTGVALSPQVGDGSGASASSSQLCHSGTELQGPCGDDFQRDLVLGVRVPGNIPIAHRCVFTGFKETARLIIVKPR